MMVAKSWNPAQSLRDFIGSESAGGIALIVAAALALFIANTQLAPSYFGFLHHEMGVTIGALSLEKSVHHWINDGLMAIFFLLIGLEVKRELIEGDLADWQRASLPVYAALGGMAAPALVYLAVTGGDGALMRGWAIPAATDIAFALGLLALLGSRVPHALKALLLAIAIIDDIGAIAIIALFYTDSLALLPLGLALLPLAGLAVLSRRKVGSLLPYLVLGAILWVLVLQSGIHATLAGVATAAFIPVSVGDDEPLERLEHALHPFVAFLILPLFAFANAGVSLAGTGLGALAAPLPLGIAAGLVVGKMLGVFGAIMATAKAGLVRLPDGVTTRQLYGLACLAGIGFTMSLFIGGLAFPGDADMDAVKIGVLTGSLVSAALGLFVLGTAPTNLETRTNA